MEPLRANGVQDILSNYTKWLNEQHSQEHRSFFEAEDRPSSDPEPSVERDHRRVESEIYALEKQRTSKSLFNIGGAGAEATSHESETSAPESEASYEQNPYFPNKEDSKSGNSEGEFEEDREDEEYGGDDDEDEEYSGDDDDDDHEEYSVDDEDEGYNDDNEESENDEESEVDEDLEHLSTNIKPQPADRLSVFKKPIETPLFNAITISDDQSAGSKIAERNLLALRGSKGSPELPEFHYIPEPYFADPNNRLRDYQTQLTLLEQQNKKRLLMPPLDKDTHTSMDAGIGLSSSVHPLASATAFQNGKTLQSGVDIRHLLQADGSSHLDLEKLQEYIEILQVEVAQLKSGQQDTSPSRFQILNRITQKQVSDRKGGAQFEWHLSSPYFDVPEWIEGQGSQRHLRCSLPLANFELYLEKNKDIAFVVYRDFHPERDIAPSNATHRPAKGTSGGAPQPTSESIRPIGRVLTEAIETLLSSRNDYSSLLSEYKSSKELHAPYLPVYNSRKDLHAIQEGLSAEAQKQFSLLLQYITDRYGDKYAAADSLFLEHKVSSENVPYLFKPGDILVERRQNRYAAFVASSWPSKGRVRYVSRLKGDIRSGENLPLYGSEESSKRVSNEKMRVQCWAVTGWYWAFDGHFQRQNCRHEFDIEVGEEINYDTTIRDSIDGGHDTSIGARQAKEQAIKDLSIFPLEYAEPDLVDRLQRRGSTFWKCRNRLLVSYMENGMADSQNMESFLLPVPVLI
ncbi:hypothetical protein LTR84_007213 [Exophiala bonariae]|uniref:DUF7025 domain-containing protein n=1 Tax=Exophiala bonariae TaxID=1690606 RepID=A0AAV9MYP8_9EURO|nr:hypothetical protein LTR84_007213 [Exophiala bonariae]